MMYAGHVQLADPGPIPSSANAGALTPRRAAEMITSLEWVLISIAGTQYPTRHSASNHHYREGKTEDDPEQHLEICSIERATAFVAQLAR
jgi:hypothetical protein